MIDEKANLRSNTGHHEASGGKVLAKRLKKIQFPSIIVGIGASAGGLSALRKLLANLGDVSNITFILIQHLNESGAALAHGVLQTLTGLEVLEIRDGISIRPGVLYHSPSHVNITLHKGILKVDAIAPTADQISNIDTFFQSLADDQGEKSIGVLLSGVGSDGTAGLKAISDAGGLTIVQSPESAEFPPMPENAIATGVIDHILLRM